MALAGTGVPELGTTKHLQSGLAQGERSVWTIRQQVTFLVHMLREVHICYVSDRQDGHGPPGSSTVSVSCPSPSFLRPQSTPNLEVKSGMPAWQESQPGGRQKVYWQVGPSFAITAYTRHYVDTVRGATRNVEAGRRRAVEAPREHLHRRYRLGIPESPGARFLCTSFGLGGGDIYSPLGFRGLHAYIVYSISRTKGQRETQTAGDPLLGIDELWSSGHSLAANPLGSVQERSKKDEGVSSAHTVLAGGRSANPFAPPSLESPIAANGLGRPPCAVSCGSCTSHIDHPACPPASATTAPQPFPAVVVKVYASCTRVALACPCDARGLVGSDKQPATSDKQPPAARRRHPEATHKCL